MLETVSDEGSSILIASLSWSMKSWLGEVWCFVRIVNLLLDPWFVLKSSLLEIIPKGAMSSKHLLQKKKKSVYLLNKERLKIFSEFTEEHDRI